MSDIAKPYQFNVKQRSCANVKSPNKRKCWTNSVGPLYQSLLWEQSPNFYFFKEPRNRFPGSLKAVLWIRDVIPDPNFFHPGPSSNNLSIFTQKIVYKLSEIWSGLFIPDTDPGSKGQKGTGSQISDPQHCLKEYKFGHWLYWIRIGFMRISIQVQHFRSMRILSQVPETVPIVSESRKLMNII